MQGGGRDSSLVDLTPKAWRSLVPWLVVGVSGVSALVLILVARALGLRLFTRLVGAGKVRPSVKFYRKFLDIMGRRGYPKNAYVTPSEFMRELRGLPPEAVLQAAYVTEQFCAVRYGGQRTSAEGAMRVEQCLAALTQLPRRNGPPPDEDDGEGSGSGGTPQ